MQQSPCIKVSKRPASDDASVAIAQWLKSEAGRRAGKSRNAALPRQSKA
jgi:hypothetical protein